MQKILCEHVDRWSNKYFMLRLNAVDIERFFEHGFLNVMAHISDMTSRGKNINLRMELDKKTTDKFYPQSEQPSSDYTLFLDETKINTLEKLTKTLHSMDPTPIDWKSGSRDFDKLKVRVFILREDTANIYVSHSRGFDYKKELYAPLRESELNLTRRLILPHEHNTSQFPSKILFQSLRCDRLILEASHPIIGGAIETGWADIGGIPITILHKAGTKVPDSLKNLEYVQTTIEYDSPKSMISVLEECI
jgi:hypothetical protein